MTGIFTPAYSVSKRTGSDGRRTLALPLAQLEGVAVDEQIRQVIEDWHYWVAQGYEL